MLATISLWCLQWSGYKKMVTTAELELQLATNSSMNQVKFEIASSPLLIALPYSCDTQHKLDATGLG